MEQIIIHATAKINLTLDILGTREDGYHEVAMIMQSLELADEVTISPRDDGQIFLTVTGNDELKADENNLAHKAARLFFDETKQCSGANIAVVKKIPMAAGLAGGSADAAAVFKGLNKIFSAGLSEEDLCRLGERIGSDIPFCIKGGTCEALSRGEVLRPVDTSLPAPFVVLAKPPVAVSTAWAYKNYDASPAKIRPDNESMKNALAVGNLDRVSDLLCNVLESVTIEKHPIIADYKEMLTKCGMKAALMSGSGPTVFALSDSAETADEAADFMRKNTTAEVFVTKFLGCVDE